MPTLLKRAQHEAELAESGLALFDSAGELTLPGRAVVEFLEHADTSALFKHPDAARHVFEADENRYLPGPVAAKMVDEDDLVGCFADYLESLGQRSLSEDAGVADKAVVRVLEEGFRLPDGYAAGAFRRTVLGPARPAALAMLKAAFGSGVIQESGSGDYNARLPATERRTQFYRRSTKALRLGRDMLDESFEPRCLLGEARTYDGALFQLAANDSRLGRPPARLGDLIEAASGRDLELIQFFLKKYSPLAEGTDEMKDSCSGKDGKKKKSKKGMEYPDESVQEFAATVTDEGDQRKLAALIEKYGNGDYGNGKNGDKKKNGGKDDPDDDDEGDDKDESINRGPFAHSVGRPSLDEGADMAANTLAAMGVGKPKPKE